MKANDYHGRNETDRQAWHSETTHIGVQSKSRAQTAAKRIRERLNFVQEKPFEGNIADRLRKQGLETTSNFNYRKVLNVSQPSIDSSSLNKSDYSMIKTNSIILPKVTL